MTAKHPSEVNSNQTTMVVKHLPEQYGGKVSANEERGGKTSTN